MMGQIVKRKKKGRPPKSDLAKRSPRPPPAPEPDVRRSLRRRSVRYNFIDYDDYIDDEYELDEEEEEEDERRRAKKLKLVVKLDQGRVASTRSTAARPARRRSAGRRGSGRRRRPRRRGAAGEEDAGEIGADDDEEERGLREKSAGLSSPRGRSRSPVPSSGIPLPDKRKLELILDKLQKKDIYGVYAEPVDPEELPDYHDMIKHPMDFSTVRKKLANGSYSTLEQFEGDVFLICSNAMQYNTPDTIYHKQARCIQELGRKKFLKLRIDFERSEKDKVKIDLEQSEKELKSDQRTKSNFLAKKQMKKHFSQPVQESDPAGVTCADVPDVLNSATTNQAAGYDRPSNCDGLVEGNAMQVENNVEKAEDLSLGKGLPSKFARKPYLHDENRRATYNITEEPGVQPDTTFSTFEGEVRQLVAVGLPVEYSYARSLARFAATLGPVAWRLASQKIERALPAGCKFGRGWVGEYEPHPTPVLLVENRMMKDSPIGTRLHNRDELKMNEIIISKIQEPAKEHSVSQLALEGKQPIPVARRSSTTNHANFQMQSPFQKNSGEPKIKVTEQFELNSLPLGDHQNAEHVAEKKFSKNSEAEASRSRESVPRNLINQNSGISGAASSAAREQVLKNNSQLQCMPSKQPDANGLVTRGLPNGKVASNSFENSRITPMSSVGIPNQMPRMISFPHGQDQGLSDPVQLMRMMSEAAQKQHNSSNHAAIDASSVMTPSSSIRRDDQSNAAATAARVWMSVGAGGLKQVIENPCMQKSQVHPAFPHNLSHEYLLHVARVRGETPASGMMQFQPSKNSFPVQTFGRPPIHMGTEAPYQNRPVVFPQFIAADSPGSQAQSPWRGVSPHAWQRQQQEMRPPDLNVGFQSPGSPAPQSSGVLVDSQQPDLALQL
ncbi:uncharacterized protein LOC104450249 [Eucalyptus grandis]|nr:uncharacterized protein LOC104450249 [Eucalyptus grandis]